MVSCGLYSVYFLVRHRLLQPGGVNQCVLRSVAFRHDGHNGKHLAVFVSRLFGFQPDSIVDRLVSGNLIRGNIHEAHRLGSCYHRCHLFIHRQLLHFLIRGLCRQRTNRQYLGHQTQDFNSCIHSIFLFITLSFIVYASAMLLFPFLPAIYQIHKCAVLQFGLVFLHRLR